MNAPRCTKTPGVACARQANHAGACTACPSACTLDWDQHYQERRAEHEQAVRVLMELDWPTPSMDDLLDY